MAKEKYSRQSFLGNQEPINQCVVGLVGMGGGGSHIVQQLSHVGFSKFRIFDPDKVEDSNLNRLVGATILDAERNLLKVKVAQRVIKSLNKLADIQMYNCKWQEKAEALRDCNIIFGCVDSFAQRRDLELCARRYFIPYIDIGMDVNCLPDQPPRMAGQIFLSMPFEPCMFCVGLLTESRLAEEASLYGSAGPRPQVVWPNGILASTAVGIAVDLLTDWTRSLRKFIYMSYDGNKLTLTPHVQLKFLNDKPCTHYITQDIGDPVQC